MLFWAEKTSKSAKPNVKSAQWLTKHCLVVVSFSFSSLLSGKWQYMTVLPLTPTRRCWVQTAGNVATYPQCSEVKNTHYPRALCILLCSSLSLGALLSMRFIARFLFFTLISQLRWLRVKALKLTYLGPNPSSACHKLCGPCCDFLIYTLRVSVAPASECLEDQMRGWGTWSHA